MKKIYSIIVALCFVLSLHIDAVAQNRYLEPVFDEVEVSGLIGYGQNYTVLGLLNPKIGHTIKQPLAMQVYSPKGDDLKDRPLILYLHTGNFLPFPLNGSCGGRLNDPSNVEFATRLAKMGYVVAVVDYRTGWNPIAEAELTRRFTLINAAYRGIQDARTCVRYFKRTVAESGNPYGINPDKITMWGQGTGGYISMAAAYANSVEDITKTSDPTKFTIQSPVGRLPMVIEKYNGNIQGTSPDILTVDATYNKITGMPIGDTLYIPNHIQYKSNFQLAVNMGGALGDSLWVSEGEIPLISFHVKNDSYAPCGTEVLNVGTQSGPQPVVEVSGSCDVQNIVERYGLNNVFADVPQANDPYGEIISKTNGGKKAFWLMDNTPDGTAAPWEWNYEDDEPRARDCNGTPEVAKKYIDTIVGYFAPRACLALDLNCNFNTSTKDPIVSADHIAVYPNPASGSFNIESDHGIIERVEIFSVAGKKLVSKLVNSTSYTYTGRLASGMYIVQAKMEKGIAVKKLVVE